MKDSELLALVRDERQRSIGFENDAELTAEREKALKYYKGEVPDVPALANRSKAVSTDVADTVETLLPDLVEIFTGGDDVAAFIPRGEEDEEAAQQETDYVNHVIFNENDGWMTLYAMFKDALLCKTGVVKFWAEKCPEEDEEFKGQSAVAFQMAAQSGEVVEFEQVEPEDGYVIGEEPLFNFTIRRKSYDKVRVMPVAPEDFAVAADTVSLRDTTYCAMRSRVRAQDLELQGFDKSKIDELPAYGDGQDETIDHARDTAGEHEQAAHTGNILRRVEITEHIVRVVEDGKAKRYCVVTGGNESILLQKEEIGHVPFAAITPFVVTHRFYGESVADRVLELQRINTALTRTALDSAFFALNQRMEVNEQQITANTLPDLLRNEPGVPIRSKGDALKPIQAASLNFDPFAALEYFQTKVEQRTGVVRNAQGLNPDTLHDTAKGALALLTAAQKRVRLIARIFAETGIKEMFLGVHALLRQHETKAAKVRLRNKWVEIDPTSWGARSDMTIEVGLGASGREADMIALHQEAEIMQGIVAMQGGPVGPIVKPEHIHALSTRMLEKLGNKAPERFLADPADPNNPPPPPQPDPKMIEAQGKMEIEKQKAAFDMQAAQQKAQIDAQNEQARFQAELAMKREQIGAEMGLKREQLAAELQLKREELQAELAIKQEAMRAQSAIKAKSVDSNVSSTVRPGGDPG